MQSLSVCNDDLVIAVTSYDVGLTVELSNQLCDFLKGCFPSNCIVINGSVTHAVAASATRDQAAPQLAMHTSSLVFWLRLQLTIQEEGVRALRTIGTTTTVGNRRDGVSLLALCACLHENDLQDVSYGLRDHIVNGQFFGSEPKKVLVFFQILIHGYHFLFRCGVFNVTLSSFISRVVRQMPPYPKVLKSHAISVFQEYACNFRHLKLICFISDDESQDHVLQFNENKSGVGHWLSKIHTLSWNGTNWKLFENSSLIATQDETGVPGGVPFYKTWCIPSLGCLQGSGLWTLVSPCQYSRIEIQIAPASQIQALPIVSNTGFPRSADSRNSNVGDDHSPSQHVVATMKANPAPSPFPFVDLVGMDAILNAIDLLAGPVSHSHELNSPLYCSLQSLLRRYLSMWSDRDGERDKWQTFYKGAITSLEVAGSRESPPSISLFSNSMNTYGCYQTHRLFSATERLMLMVSCSWPAFKWTNIDQTKADEMMTRIRGMSFSHPRVVQFMRQRMLDEKFINNDDFPLAFSLYSHVNIASNMCHSAMSTWKWSEDHCFVFDQTVEAPFLTLEGCGNEFNADGVYAATTSRHDGKIVYAVLTSDVITIFQRNGVQTLRQIPKNSLFLPTIVLVTFSDGPILHAVQFSFALNSMEPIVKRESNGTYSIFFSVNPTNAMFLYRQMSVQPTLQIFGTLPATFDAKVCFPFGCYIKCQDDIARKRESLTDEALRTDGYPGPQEWHSNSDPKCCTLESAMDNSISTKANASSGKSVKKVKETPVYFSLNDAHKSSWSAMCAVFPDTYLGVLVDNFWKSVKISDGCCFLFSFWLKHFRIGKEKFDWHLCLHGYYHSKDIRHFPVNSPESLFVVFAAIKIIDQRRCLDRISQDGLEALILHMLITNTNKALNCEGLPSFRGLDQGMIKQEADGLYEFLYPAIVPAAAPADDGWNDDYFPNTAEVRNSEDNPVATMPPIPDDDIVVSRNANAALPPVPQSKMRQLDEEIVHLQTLPANVAAAASVSAPADVTIIAFDIVSAKFCCDLPALPTVQAFDSSATNPFKEPNSASDDSVIVISDTANNGSLEENGQDLHDREVFLPPSAAVSVGTSFIGLRNLGLTCGMNASLQCLLHTMELKKYFYGSNPSDCDHTIICIFKAMVNIGEGGCVITMLEVLRDFLHVQLAEKDSSYNPAKGKPADSSEILGILLEIICPSRFRVTIESEVSCLVCQTQSEKSEEQYLSLPFPPLQKNRNAATLELALQLFQAKEPFSSDNRWFCPQCKKETSSQKQLILVSLPNCFFIHLKRFESVFEKGVFVEKRINRIFEVPFEHDFGQLGVFRLYAAICHYSGIIGHFVAYCRPNPTDSWMLCDDSTIVAKSDEEVFKDIKHNGYVFFYQRQTTASLKAIAQNISVCRSLQTGFMLLNQLSLIAHGYAAERQRVESLCGSLEQMADAYIRPGDARRNFVLKCEELAISCDGTAADAAKQPSMQPGYRDQTHPDVSGSLVNYLVAEIARSCKNSSLGPPVVNATASHHTISGACLMSSLNHEQLEFSFRIEKRGSSDVITAYTLKSAQLPSVADLFQRLFECVPLPFYIMSADHARLFVKRTIWQDMDEDGWVEPSMWSCPMDTKFESTSSSRSLAVVSPDTSQFSDQRYSKFLEWLDMPPTFQASLTRGRDVPFPRLNLTAFLNDVKVIKSLIYTEK